MRVAGKTDAVSVVRIAVGVVAGEAGVRLAVRLGVDAAAQSRIAHRQHGVAGAVGRQESGIGGIGASPKSRPMTVTA